MAHESSRLEDVPLRLASHGRVTGRQWGNMYRSLRSKPLGILIHIKTDNSPQSHTSKFMRGFSILNHWERPIWLGARNIVRHHSDALIPRRMLRLGAPLVLLLALVTRPVRTT